MNYKEELVRLVEKYYHEVIEKYKFTTLAAMKDGKKLGLFKKRDFSQHIKNFQEHIDVASEIKTDHIEIPSDDVPSKVLADYLEKSIHSFSYLCEMNKKFYDLSDKKQYRDSGVSMDAFKLAYSMVQTAMSESVADLETLDKAFQEYTGNLAEK